jgi:TonB-dependent receptor|tara:strand:+ start:182 stop:3283 length:3102 start_codon:yes stop_codon:yes gene_type:complete
MFRKSKLSVAILAAAGTLAAGQVFADSSTLEEVVVTGIRGSLERAMDTKRDASGVVDAISAEDMGKFPDTNLAESLQRISGVSINRVNGEGSEVTVRGFGGGFNLVTVNGRQMPSANVGTITGNPLDQGASGNSRSFDFSNLASEGVRGIQVYKTGRSAVSSGGVGATINVETIRPLDVGGTQASVGVKAVKDTSGDGTTPEVSGLYSWANDDSTLGVSVFGSFQERDSGSRHASVEEFGLRTWDSTDPKNLSKLGIVEGATIINTPNDGQLVYRPTNLGVGFNEDKRERTNGLLTVQFAPNDSMTFTADAAYAENVQDSFSLIDGVWFNGTVDYVEYDGNPVVAAPVIFAEDVDGGKDFFFQNLAMGTKDTLESIGLNLDWNVSDTLNLRFDGASSEAKSGGNGPQGNNVLRMNVAGGNSGWQAVDFSQDIPQGIVSVDDSAKGNNNGIFDLADVGSQVTQFASSDQVATIDQFTFDGTFVASDRLEIDFGMGYMSSEMQQTRTSGSSGLGGWGVDAPGDIPEGLIEQVSTIGEFDYSGSGVAGVSQPANETAPIALGSVSWRGDPLALLNAMAPLYNDANGVPLDPNNMPLNSSANNLVEEDTISFYGEMKLDSEIGGLPVDIVAGVRWEETDVTSTSLQTSPAAFNWTSNNDFEFTLGTGIETLVDDHSYSVLLPRLDMSMDITDNLKARVSFSKTAARPGYSDMYTATSLEAPSRITYLGDQPSASYGNARLDPLESTNFDFSVEYYYGEANYFSVGFFQKDVSNFVGVQQENESLFGLKDATAASSTFLAEAITQLASIGVDESEDALFSMTAILQNIGDFTETTGAAAYEAAAGAAATTQAFHEEIFGEYNVTPVDTDPLIEFAVKSPTNSKTAEIYGFELASQHFFGDTGFGYQFNYTTVSGDIGYENGSDPAEDQFALPGLSDTMNLVGIYEKDGLSARLAYNWRDAFLSQVNRSVGSTRNPEYTDSVEQLDLNVSYEFDSGLTFALDAINLTGEGQRKYGRNKNATFFVQELDPRYVFSARYTF